MSNSKISGPPVSFLFQLSFDVKEDEDKGVFQEVSGISLQMNIEELENSGENRFEYRLPRAVKYDNLVLKRGLISKNSSLCTWIVNALDSGLNKPIEPKNISVALLDPEHETLRKWDFTNAYPVKWEISDFESMDSHFAIETIEFAYNFFKRTN